MITAHPGDFVWRAGGAIALHAAQGLPREDPLPRPMASAAKASSPGRQAGVTLDDVKAQRRDEAERAAAILGAEIEFFDAGDYPLRTTPEMLDRAGRHLP